MKLLVPNSNIVDNAFDFWIISEAGTHGKTCRPDVLYAKKTEIIQMSLKNIKPTKRKEVLLPIIQENKTEEKRQKIKT